LLSLGDTCYLEIVGPDPAWDPSRGPRLFGIDELAAPRLVTWSAAHERIGELDALDLGGGARLGPVLDGCRETPEGERLTWRLTDPFTVVADGLVPFFIDWGASAHPARRAPSAGTLTRLRAEHPEPDRMQVLLGRLDLDLAIVEAALPALSATIESPLGSVELR
jgi:hypothetical protein